MGRPLLLRRPVTTVCALARLSACCAMRSAPNNSERIGSSDGRSVGEPEKSKIRSPIQKPNFDAAARPTATAAGAAMSGAPSRHENGSQLKKFRAKRAESLELCARAGPELHGQAGRPGNEIGSEPCGCFGDPQIVHARQHLGQDRVDLDARNVLAQASMRACSE